MKYLRLICVDEHQLEKGSVDPVQTIEWLEHTEALRKSGRPIAAERLESVPTATMVRGRDDRISATDGPFAETRELIAG